jgi:heat shock protein HtpX
MAIETFNTLIARNKRNSWLLIGVFMVLFVGLGLLIGNVWGGGDAAFSITVAVAAGGVAFLLTLLSYYSGAGAVLAMSSAHQIEKADDPQLFNVIEELTIAAGIPMPRIYVIADAAPNAFATGRNPANAAVAITTGLREKLTRDELQGVMAHELGHVQNYDILFAMLMAVMVGVLVMLCDVFMRSMWWGGGRRRSSNDRDRDSGGLQAVLMIIALVLAILAPFLAKIIQMAMSRQREYLADASSVELTRNPLGLANALAKIAGDPDELQVANRATAHLYIVNPIMKLKERESTMFDSHPPIQDRINRLMDLAK